MSLKIGIDYLCGIAAYADLRLAVGEVLPKNQIDNDETFVCRQGGCQGVSLTAVTW